jgi:RNA polymerase sigma factor (sigma-70 family)
LKVFIHVNKYDSAKPFKAWLGRIMTNASIDYYRSNIKMSLMDDLDAAEHISNDDFPDKKLSYDELLSMIQKLPTAYRTVFNLYAIEGYTHEEIGQMLNISSGTSKSNLFKAREKLKTMIKEADQLPGLRGNSYSTFVAINPVDLKVTFIYNGFIR